MNALVATLPTTNTIDPLQPSWVHRTEGMHVHGYELPLERIPADFYADPDGAWTFELLTRAAGFGGEPDVAIGALREPFNGHPDGSAVVTLNAASRPYVAIIECPIVYHSIEADSRASAA